MFCNYFYTYIRLDVSASELLNIFLSRLASPASFSLGAEGVVVWETVGAYKHWLQGSCLPCRGITILGVLLGTRGLLLNPGGRYSGLCLANRKWRLREVK